METVAIPEFSFSNRKDEIKYLKSFLLEKTEYPKLLLLAGAGGIGKSRLIREMIDNHCSSQDVVRLNFTEKLKHIGLISSVKKECEHLNKLIQISFPKESLKLKAHRLLNRSKTIIPSLGKLLPYGGELAKQTIQELLNTDSKSQLVSLKNWIDYFILLVSIYSTEKKLAIIVDDYHTLQSDEKLVLVETLSQLIEESVLNVNIIVSTRNLYQEIDDPLYIATKQASESGQLLIYPLAVLNDQHMEDIAKNLFSNPSESIPLIKLSNGNPQELRNNLINLNISGQLKSINNEVILPKIMSLDSPLVSEKWKLITSDSCISDVAIIVALRPLPVKLNEIYNYLGVLERWNKSTIVEAINFLNNLDVLSIESSDNNEVFVDFSHDILKEQVLEKAKETSLIKYLYLCEQSANYLKNEIEENLDSSLDQFLLFEENSNVFDHINIEDINLIISLAKNYKEAQLIGWEPLIFNVFQLCHIKGYRKETKTLGLNIFEHFEKNYSEQSKIIIKIKEILIVCLYELGDYLEVIRISSNYITNNESTLYAIALSIIKEKKTSDWFLLVSNIIKNFLEENSHYKKNPLLNSIIAIGHRENNNPLKGEELLSNIFAEKNMSSKISWYKFLSISSLYFESEEGKKSAKEAISYHNATGDPRGEGLTYTNLGVMCIRDGDIESAFDYFQLGEEKLKNAAVSDVIFPMLNKAAIHIIKGEYELALSLLRACLFRRCPDEELLSIYVNLALAEWGAGLKVDISKIKKLQNKNTNSWLKWMTAYSLAFIELNEENGSLSDEKVSNILTELKKQDPNYHSSYYWNNLVKRIFGEIKAVTYYLPTRTKMSALDKLVKSEISFRPILLSFGHV
jgi:uncharacterized protein YqeY